jgi:hypothetical protein
MYWFLYLGGLEGRAPCLSAWVIEPACTALGFPQYPALSSGGLARKKASYEVRAYYMKD